MHTTTHRRRKKRLKKQYRTIITLLLLFFISVVVFNAIFGKSQELPDIETASPSNVEEPEPVINKTTLLAAGDIMVHTPQIRQAAMPGGGYDFSPSFEFIARYIKKADLAVANLETTFGGAERGYDGYPLFNTPDEMAENLKNAGFDILCTANNHSLDSWEKGLYRTLDFLETVGLGFFGTARSLEERNTPLVVNVNGIKIAFLAYTDSTNGLPIPTGKDYIINFIDLNKDTDLVHARNTFSRDIERARQEGADVVVVYMHWGHEYHFSPNDWQRKLAQTLAEEGADLILGSHPHVIQPMEYIEVQKANGDSRRVFVAYSMGNFISNQHYISGQIPTEEVKYGLVLLINLEKEMHSGKTEIKDINYMITWVNRDSRHQVLPVHEVLERGASHFNIPSHKFARITPVYENIRERLKGFSPAFPAN